jgi:RuvA N terminal domain
MRKGAYLMKTIIVLFAFMISSSVWAAKSYQVTGQVTDVTATTITVDKKGEKFEIEVPPTTQSSAKKGDKVTVYYRMSAENIEQKEAAKEKKPKN